MKIRNVSFVFLLLGYSYSSYTQWNIVYSLDGACAKDIEFTTSSDGYFVTNSIIGKTNDGGESWDLDTLDGVTDLRVIDFIDVDTGLLCCRPGDDQDLLLTFDGGDTWIYPELDQSVSISDVDLLEGGRAVYSECLGFITPVTVTTEYYGNVFTTSSLPPASTCSDILFVNKDVGFTIGDFVTGDPFIPTVYKTIDGGLSWYSHENMYGPLYYITFPNEQIGYGIGYESRVWKTEDGGETWIMLPYDFGGYEELDLNLSLGKIYFFSDSIGLLQVSEKVDEIFHPGVYRTINGGESWYKTDIDISSHQLYDFYCTSSDTCFAATCEAIFRTINGGGLDTSNVDVTDLSNLTEINIYPNPTDGIVSIDLTNDSEIPIITNIFGQQFNYSIINLNNSLLLIDISNLPNGIYFIFNTKDSKAAKIIKL